MELSKPCSCGFTGFVGKVICVNHLEQAFNLAIAWGDKELAAVIVAKQQRRI